MGLVAGLLFLSVIQSLLVLRAGQTDALLILWTTLGLYGLLRHLAAGPPPVRRRGSLAGRPEVALH